MEESHHRSIMDHLDIGSGGHHLQEDLSKGVLRTIHNVENGTLHFITIPPASNSREQEYIESSLLGADLLSSHLPNGMLVDYISNPGPSTPSGQYHQQSASLLDHHNGIQTYTAEDLQTLVDASSLQTSENDRKLFLQFVNKPTTQLSHEAPVIVTNPKDMSSLNSLTEHDKLTQSTHSQSLASVNHMAVPASANSFIHYHHQDQLLSTTHSNVANLNNTVNVLNSHHGTHHHSHQQQHHPHHHHQHSHQIIQNTTQLQQQPSLVQATQQQPNQQLLSSIHPLLQNDCTPAKLFHVSSSSPASTTISINTTASQNQCITIPPLAPIRRVESPKRYITYQMAPSEQTSTLVRTSSEIMSTESFLSREDLIECDSRSDEDEDQESAVTNPSTNNFVTNYLPHKKRLAKKLGDPKSTNPPDQFLRNSVISSEHQSLSNTCIAKEPLKQFACQLCSVSFDDQLEFFTHLKGHYEPLAENPSNESKNNDPKKKPKLPRVKHTKKLKNDKSSRAIPEDESREPSYQSNPKTFVSQRVSNTDSESVYQQPVQLSSVVTINHQQHSVLTTACGTDPEAAGEFSETEDMLEGIRTVVQKVQDAVDTDTNDGLGLHSVERIKILSSGNTVDDKAWFQSQQQQVVPVTTDIGKQIQFNNEVDAQEIHINSGNDNFVLFINKGDFQDQDILKDANHQQDTAEHHQPTNRQSSNPSILSHALSSSHDPSTSYIMDTESSLQQATIGECDMNSIQILSLGTNDIENHEIAKLVDFNLTTPPHMNVLTGAKLLKDHHKNSLENSNDVEFSDCELEEYYPSENDDVGDDDVSEDHDELVADGQQYERVEQIYDVSVITSSSAPPGKKKGRKKANGNEADETINEDGTKKASKKYPCEEPDCDKVFNSKTAVRYHELQHKNERPFHCTECPKNFFTSSALKVHERLHSGEKPYKCEECGRAFRQWGDMKYHQASIHSNEKTHQCEFCGKKFARRYSLVLHRKIHLNEKNHVCDICNKAFRASSYLQSHRMIHTGEKPHSCTFCQKKFRCGGDMKRHLKTHDRNKTASNSHKTTVHSVEGQPVKVSPKTIAAIAKTCKKRTTNIIDLTKIKTEGGSKTWTKQTPVVTVLSKDINHAVGGSGSRISSSSASSGQLVYLTQAAGDQFRKPEETVLVTDITRW